MKWNGIRTLTARTADGWRLWGRELGDYRDRYPELNVLTTFLSAACSMAKSFC